MSLGLDAKDIPGHSSQDDLVGEDTHQTLEASVQACAHALPAAVGHQPSAFYDEAIATLYERREAENDEV